MILKLKMAFLRLLLDDEFLYSLRIGDKYVYWEKDTKRPRLTSSLKYAGTMSRGPVLDLIATEFPKGWPSVSYFNRSK